jgi:hypothetical protein
MEEKQINREERSDILKREKTRESAPQNVRGDKTGLQGKMEFYKGVQAMRRASRAQEK